MKLFWKFFCSMIAVTMISSALGGFFLIDTQFRTAIAREVDALYEENDLLRYTLVRELEASPVDGVQEFVELVRTIRITTGGSTVAFRITDSGGNPIIGQGSIPVSADTLTGMLSASQRGWALEQTPDEKNYLHAASAFLLGEEVLYLESCYDVSDLFAARDDQYRNFLGMMAALVAAAGIVSFLLTSLMLRPLKRLSKAAGMLAQGELHQRVRIDTDDELGRLSADFNTMAVHLEEMVQQLRDAARRQEDFMGSFAHEIKTPLTSMIGYAELLRSREPSPALVQKSADYIFREGRRLEALSRKLMDLIVLERGELAFRRVAMELFLNRIGTQQQVVLAQKGIKLEVETEPKELSIEPDLLETVLLNLLDNARKSLEEKGRGVILISAWEDEEEYCICISDNGKGIPTAELDRITEAFYMVDKSRARAQGGAGLGLALCERIVSLHGGRIEFESAEGVGTEVYVYLAGGEAA